ncbi:MAG: hypothetical protein V1736_11315 [Pseudomonadota bacterium]
MAQKSGASFQKREKERKRQEKQRMKRDRRIEAKKDKIDGKSRTEEEGGDTAYLAPDLEDAPPKADEEPSE